MTTNLHNLLAKAGIQTALKPAPAPAPAQDDEILPGDELTVTFTNTALSQIPFLYGVEVLAKELEVEILAVRDRDVLITCEELKDCAIPAYLQFDDGVALITAVKTATPADLQLYHVYKRLNAEFQAQGYRPTPPEWVRLGMQCRAEGTNNAA